jgi:integrase
MDIKSSIMKNKPNLSQSSIRTYMTNINSTARDIGIPLQTTSDIVKHYKTILESLNDINTNSRKTRLASFIVALDDGSSKHSSALKDMRVVMNKDLDTIRNKDMNQELSESQKENFIPWTEVLEKYKVLEDEVQPLFKSKTLSSSQQQKLQLYILLSLYTKIPPRRSLDYTDMKIRNINKETDNYISFGAKPYLVFNNYKNAKRLGSQKVDIPKELASILKKYINKVPHDQEYLIVNSVGNPVIQTFVTKVLNNFFGKKISSSMLRHIYLTHEFGDVDLKKLDETTKDMGNSEIDRSLKYVVK